MPDLVPPDDSHYILFDQHQHPTTFLNRSPNSYFDSSRLKKDVDSIPVPNAKVDALAETSALSTYPLDHWPSRPLSLDLQRPFTHPRQESETRDRLKPYQLSAAERRLGYTMRKRAHSATGQPSSRKAPAHRRSAPEIRTASADVSNALFASHAPVPVDLNGAIAPIRASPPHNTLPDVASPLDSPRSSLDDERLSRHSSSYSDGLNDPAFWRELESRWILNLSMAFRDDLEREKFFITFAEKANRWRRVTVSVDYRNKPHDSLEVDLKTLPFQRDKSAHIYEAIRESLTRVQFYDTVTNLNLETADGRLHVHVTEDLNEIIKYPPIAAISHLDLGLLPKVLESDLHFQSHLSGFVYKVLVHGRSFIKKEIPGPDMIDEFLYEVNALWDLRDSEYVIDFCAIVLDDKQELIKGLLISFADRGTLVDVIYDNRDPPLPWETRDKWAKQIVAGLADIHEHGFVQGDFTLSNIVIDNEENARIIDINRRGCPVGWEPPEFQGLIDSGLRISMYIGTKSDLYQLGMVLWALAELDDEPERADELTLEGTESGAPEYLIKWVKSCLSQAPQQRLSAKDLLYNSSALNQIQISPVPRIEAVQPPPAVRYVCGDADPEDAGVDWRQMSDYNQGINMPPPERETQYEDGDLLATEHAHSMNPKEPSEPQPCSSTQPSQFNPPVHQDSGLGGMEYGRDDSLTLNLPKYEPPTTTLPFHRRGPTELTGTGGQFG